MKKGRSSIAKLVSKSRETWRQSEPYYACKRMSRSANIKGWFTCALCLKDREVIKIDHILPIGKQPDEMIEFGSWLEKLFCPLINLQGICTDCHKEKTKQDNKRTKSRA